MSIERLFATALFFSCAGIAGATERYTDARIAQVETSENTIIVFLEFLSGDTPPLGNGLSNQPTAHYWLYIAGASGEIPGRRHMFASALVAQSRSTDVRIRWEDSTNRIIALLDQD